MHNSIKDLITADQWCWKTVEVEQRTSYQQHEHMHLSCYVSKPCLAAILSSLVQFVKIFELQKIKVLSGSL